MKATYMPCVADLLFAEPKVVSDGYGMLSTIPATMEVCCKHGALRPLVVAGECPLCAPKSVLDTPVGEE